MEINRGQRVHRIKYVPDDLQGTYPALLEIFWPVDTCQPSEFLTVHASMLKVKPTKHKSLFCGLLGAWGPV